MKNTHLQNEKGVLIASDKTLEWLVPYWYYNYRLHNDYPVAIVDFGLSDEMVSWCKERMLYKKLEQLDFTVEKDAVSQDLRNIWGSCVKGDVYLVRKQWFKKPFALAKTPFRRTLWLDVDCEVKANLSPVFAMNHLVAAPLMHPAAEAHLLDMGAVPKGQKNYSSGMILYDREAPLINLFKQFAAKENHKFLGDQDLFSHLAHKYQFEVGEMPSVMHCEIRCGLDHRALVWHYTGDQKSLLWDKSITLRKSTFLTREF